MTVTWDAASDDSGTGTKQYRVIYASDGAPTGGLAPFVLVDGLTTTLTGLKPGRTYSVRVCSVDNAGNVSSGTTASAATLACTNIAHCSSSNTVCTTASDQVCESCDQGWAGSNCSSCGTGWSGASCDIPGGGALYTRTVVDQTFAFSYIPAGTFVMGSPDSDTQAYDREKPQHSVTLTTPFLMQRTETTQSQYEAVTGTNPSFLKGASYPNAASYAVEQVTWDDAVSFCDALSQWEGVAAGTYGLPSEAEWEYAARAGSTAIRYGALSDIAWYGEYIWSGYPGHVVGGKAPNAWGLHDMLGNVWEMTADWLLDARYDAGPATDPRGPPSGTSRVTRGGCLANDSRDLRAAMRNGMLPTTSYNLIGFRIRRTVP
jgi:formylglycine-generating enzyme required for sulfatase activity